MKNQFIPYNLSVELKELGFDDQCFAHYRDSETLVACNQGIWGVSYSELELPTTVVLSPTYQQVFDWFRNKHCLHSWVIPCYVYINPDVKTHYDVIIDDKIVGYCKTFEESRLKNIEKLIELIKK
ncbi:MAG: hypothetical protein ACOC2W_03285 [bacterium]